MPRFLSRGPLCRSFRQYRNRIGKTLSFSLWSWLAGLFCRLWQCGISWCWRYCCMRRIWRTEQSSRISRKWVLHLGLLSCRSISSLHRIFQSIFLSIRKRVCRWLHHRAFWIESIMSRRWPLWGPYLCLPSLWYPLVFSIQSLELFLFWAWWQSWVVVWSWRCDENFFAKIFFRKSLCESRDDLWMVVIFDGSDL